MGVGMGSVGGGVKPVLSGRQIREAAWQRRLSRAGHALS